MIQENINLSIASKAYDRGNYKRLLLEFPEQEFVKDIFAFLNEWWNDKSYITAFTSGSTGIPKKIILEKEKMRQSAIATGTFFNLKEKDRVCCPMSASFIAGKMMLVRAIVLKLELHFLEPSTDFLKHLEGEYQFLVMTPHQLAVQLTTPSVNKLGQVEKILLGGSPLKKELEREIATINTSFFIGYGMTETMSHVAIRKINGNNSTLLYKAVKNVEFTKDDRSCLVIHADKILDKALVTNDLVELHDKTSFIWKSRYDHVINSGGIKLFPEDVENKLRAIIEQPFYISSQPHPKLGDELVIYIESKKALDLSSIKQEANDCLEKYERPKKWFVVKEFNYTENGKLIR